MKLSLCLMYTCLALVFKKCHSIHNSKDGKQVLLDKLTKTESIELDNKSTQISDSKQLELMKKAVSNANTIIPNFMLANIGLKVEVSESIAETIQCNELIDLYNKREMALEYMLAEGMNEHHKVLQSMIVDTVSRSDEKVSINHERSEKRETADPQADLAKAQSDLDKVKGLLVNLQSTVSENQNQECIIQLNDYILRTKEHGSMVNMLNGVTVELMSFMSVYNFEDNDESMKGIFADISKLNNKISNLQEFDVPKLKEKLETAQDQLKVSQLNSEQRIRDVKDIEEKIQFYETKVSDAKSKQKIEQHLMDASMPMKDVALSVRSIFESLKIRKKELEELEQQLVSVTESIDTLQVGFDKANALVKDAASVVGSTDNSRKEAQKDVANAAHLMYLTKQAKKELDDAVNKKKIINDNIQELSKHIDEMSKDLEEKTVDLRAKFETREKSLTPKKTLDLLDRLESTYSKLSSLVFGTSSSSLSVENTMSGDNHPNDFSTEDILTIALNEVDQAVSRLADLESVISNLQRNLDETNDVLKKAIKLSEKESQRIEEKKAGVDTIQSELKNLMKEEQTTVSQLQKLQPELLLKQSLNQVTEVFRLLESLEPLSVSSVATLGTKHVDDIETTTLLELVEITGIREVLDSESYTNSILSDHLSVGPISLPINSMVFLKWSRNEIQDNKEDEKIASRLSELREKGAHYVDGAISLSRSLRLSMTQSLGSVPAEIQIEKEPVAGGGLEIASSSSSSTDDDTSSFLETEEEKAILRGNMKDPKDLVVDAVPDILDETAIEDDWTENYFDLKGYAEKSHTFALTKRKEYKLLNNRYQNLHHLAFTGGEGDMEDEYEELSPKERVEKRNLYKSLATANDDWVKAKSKAEVIDSTADALDHMANDAHVWNKKLHDAKSEQKNQYRRDVMGKLRESYRESMTANEGEESSFLEIEEGNDNSYPDGPAQNKLFDAVFESLSVEPQRWRIKTKVRTFEKEAFEGLSDTQNQWNSVDLDQVENVAAGAIEKAIDRAANKIIQEKLSKVKDE